MELNSFENHVFDNLRKNGCDFASLKKTGSSLGAAVSGGADSICLLLCLSKICKENNCSLKVISVDHKIRSKEESSGDVLFVDNFCLSLRNQGYDVEFHCHELKEGEVISVSEVRKSGIEEAARFLRYKAFYDFSKKFNIPFICLAHNQNDQLETLLMRFLQGSGSGGLSGIREKREIFLRPLLDIDRNEIENYLIANKVSWRTDKTNFDEHYLRNRIRHSVIPLLNDKFPGWKKSVLGGKQRFEIDENYFNEACEKILPKDENCNSIEFERSAISSLHKSVAIRVIFNSISKLNSNARISFILVNRFIESIQTDKITGEYECSELCLLFNKQSVYIKTRENIATDLTFFAIIDKCGSFDFPFGVIQVFQSNDSFCIQFEDFLLQKIKLPICIRNRQFDDKIKMIDNQLKSVSDILSDYHVPVELKNRIPVVQELFSKKQEIIGIIGSVYGYKNWIVRT